MSLTQALPYELAQEFGIVPLQDEGAAIAVATAPHMTVAALGAARQRLGKPLRTQSVDAVEFRKLLTQSYAVRSVRDADALPSQAERPRRRRMRPSAAVKWTC